MSQTSSSLEATNPAAQPSPAERAKQARELTAGRAVCPFCGGQRADNASGACPRCTMEDTPATRQATVVRVGPWFVLQSRNPAAPGMKWATLVSLVRRGQINARSVVRGPTTMQLWTFAAKVRGLSRELGVCYACGHGLVATAARCAACEASQEPPANPDQLLDAPESRDTRDQRPAPTPMPRVPTRATGDVPARLGSRDAIAGIETDDARELRELRDARDSRDPRESRAAAPLATTAAPLGDAFALAPARPAPVPRAPRPARPATPGNPTDDAILTAAELATAFQLGAGAPRKGRLRRFVGKSMLLLLLLGLVGGGVLMYVDEEARRVGLGWGQQAIDWVRTHVSRTTANPTADGNLKPVPLNPAPTGGDNAGGAGQAVGSVPNGVASSQANPGNPVDDASAAAVGNDIRNAAALPRGVEDAQPRPASLRTDPPAVSPATPPAAPAPAVPADAVAAARELARGLHRQAIEAQGRQDWPKALQLLEQIKTLPREVQPGDVDVRLRLVKQQMGN
jgi:hypothetical protein